MHLGGVEIPELVLYTTVRRSLIIEINLRLTTELRKQRYSSERYS